VFDSLFSALAQVNFSVPGPDSPWFFWGVAFIIAVAGITISWIAFLKAAKLTDAKKETGGLFAIAVMSGLIGGGGLTASFRILFRIFDSVLPIAAN